AREALRQPIKNTLLLAAKDLQRALLEGDSGPPASSSSSSSSAPPSAAAAAAAAGGGGDDGDDGAASSSSEDGGGGGGGGDAGGGSGGGGGPAPSPEALEAKLAAVGGALGRYSAAEAGAEGAFEAASERTYALLGGLVGRMMLELDTAGNIRLEEGRPGDLWELRGLASLPRLADLCFSDPMWGDCPLAQLCNYQTFVLFMMPRLTSLDTLLLADETKALAEATFLKKQMYYNMRVKTLRRNARQIIKLAAEGRQVHLVASRFNFSDYPAVLGVHHLAVTGVTRIHNRWLRTRFEAALTSSSVDTADPGHKRSLEYLFLGEHPALPELLELAVEEGLPEGEQLAAK
ncbi:Leucine-rich repeat-containing protein 9, partial [Tetrabaena socialis]